MATRKMATKRTARNSTFQRGTGCFNCEACGRRTRETGHGAYGIKLCDQCYDLAGIYNEYQDGYIDEVKAQRESIVFMCNFIVEKGGTLDGDALFLLDFTKPADEISADAEAYLKLAGC